VADDIPARLTGGDARRFGVVVGAAFVLLGALAAARGRGAAGALLAGVGAALVLTALLQPRALVPVERGWMATAVAMARVTTPVLLGVVYFGVITPIGVVRRLVGGNALAPAPRPRGGAAGWAARDARSQQRTDMERQF
jgi:hypothetical protein